MVKLIARTACADLLPKTIGEVTLTEVAQQDIYSIAPFHGQEKLVAAELTEAVGVGFPAPNRMKAKAGVRTIWAGAGRALLAGAIPPDLGGKAAVTDQSDGWAIVRIDGPSENILARLIPVDLRASVFKRGHTARTMVGHMAASVTRTGTNSIEIMVMRSMAQTLVHELTEAAEAVTARK